MKFIIAFIITLFFFYLLGSFIAMSLNIADWSIEGRAFIAFIGTFLAAAVGGVVHD